MVRFLFFLGGGGFSMRRFLKVSFGIFGIIDEIFKRKFYFYYMSCVLNIGV